MTCARFPEAEGFDPILVDEHVELWGVVVALTNPHRRDLPQHHASRRLALHPMTADSLELVSHARRGIEAAWRDGYAFTKAGIMLDDLVSVADRPRTLFEGDVDRRERLMTAIDAVNDRYGRFTAVPAAQGFKREWRARADSNRRRGRPGC